MCTWAWCLPRRGSCVALLWMTCERWTAGCRTDSAALCAETCGPKRHFRKQLSYLKTHDLPPATMARYSSLARWHVCYTIDQHLFRYSNALSFGLDDHAGHKEYSITQTTHWTGETFKTRESGFKTISVIHDRRKFKKLHYIMGQSSVFRMIARITWNALFQSWRRSWTARDVDDDSCFHCSLERPLHMANDSSCGHSDFWSHDDPPKVLTACGMVLSRFFFSTSARGRISNGHLKLGPDHRRSSLLQSRRVEWMSRLFDSTKEGTNSLCHRVCVTHTAIVIVQKS